MNFLLSQKVLALLNNGNANAGGGFLDSLKGPMLIVVIALSIAILIAFIIFIVHRDGARARYKDKRGARLTEANYLSAKSGNAQSKKRRRHKRRRRQHRKRNPTLSETGGLPSKTDSASEGDKTDIAS